MGKAPVQVYTRKESLNNQYYLEMSSVNAKFSGHRPPPGRRSAPPDDRLQRAIQYSEPSAIELKSRGVLDTPHARGMTAFIASVY
jgi:hypothetical protein